MTIQSAPKIMFIGGTGTGKTYSTAMLARAGIEVRFIFTENGMDTLNSLPSDVKKLVGTKIHYSYIPAVSDDFSTLLGNAERVNTLTYENLCKMAPSDKLKTNEMVKILKAFKNYKSDITGEEFGSVDSWDNTVCLAMDSLTGLNVAALRCVVGTKPAIGMQDWGVAMTLEEQLLQKLCLACNCWVIVNAHMDRETDEVTGGTRVYPAALGKKLGPKIGRFFSEVLETKRIGSEYCWSNMSDTTDLKQRLIPLSAKITPNWEALVKIVNPELFTILAK